MGNVVLFRRRGFHAAPAATRRLDGMCIRASASYVTPGIPASEAAAITRSQYSTGIEPLRFCSPAVDAALPITRPKAALPPKASMSAETVSGVETESVIPNVYRISVGGVNRISVDNPCQFPDMGDSNDRLRMARSKAGFKTAADAIKRFGWKETTYRSHENGQTPVPTEEAALYGRAYKVSPAWILTGEGRMEAQNLVKLMGRIGAGGMIDPEYEQIPEGGLDEIELPFPAGMDAVAFEVSGTSMLPKYEDGTLVVCSTGPRSPDDFLNVEVAVRTARGQRYLKKLRPGSRRGLYNLESFNDALIEDVKIAWVGEILVIIPAGRRARSALRPRKRAAG